MGSLVVCMSLYMPPHMLSDHNPEEYAIIMMMIVIIMVMMIMNTMVTLPIQAFSWVVIDIIILIIIIIIIIIIFNIIFCHVCSLNHSSLHQLPRSHNHSPLLHLLRLHVLTSLDHYDRADGDDDDDDFLHELVTFFLGNLIVTLLLPTRVASAMVSCKAQRMEGPPLKAHRRPLGVCPRPPGALFGAIFSAPPPGPPNPQKLHHPLPISLFTV